MHPMYPPAAMCLSLCTCVLQISNAPMHLILMRFRRYFCLSDHSCGSSRQAGNSSDGGSGSRDRESSLSLVEDEGLHTVSKRVYVCRELKILHANMILEKRITCEGISSNSSRLTKRVSTHNMHKTQRTTNFAARDASRCDVHVLPAWNLHVHALSHQSQRM